MTLSSRTIYGCRFLIYLGEHYNQEFIQLKEAAADEGLPLKYLEQIIPSLKGAGLLQVTRGSRGGYRLSEPPEKISMLRIIEALNGDLDLIPPTSEEKKSSRLQILEEFLSQFSSFIKEYLMGTSLQDLVEKGQKSFIDFAGL